MLLYEKPTIFYKNCNTYQGMFILVNKIGSAVKAKILDFLYSMGAT